MAAYTAKLSRNFTSVAPSPSLLPSPSFVFSPTPIITTTHRPNKAELEARLAGAHTRARARRLRETLGHEKRPTTTTTTPARTTRAPAFSLQSGDARAPTIIYSTPTALPASPLSQVAYLGAGYHHYHAIPSAPSPSMLPPPPATPRPLFPRRRSRAPVRAPAIGLGLGLSFGASAPFDFVETDAPLTPHHVFPETLRRTPGAPLRATPSVAAAEVASYLMNSEPGRL